MTNDPKSQVPMTSSAPLPAELADATALDCGRGVSTSPDDASTPLITPLQNGSPECDRRGPDFIANAEPGKFRLHGTVNPIRDEIIVIPCAMRQVWMEWFKDRGGYADKHLEEPDDLQTMPSQDGKRSIQVRPNGNVVEFTREFFVLCDNQPYLLPCKSTAHQFAREWQGWFRQWRHPRTNAVLPSFSRKYKLVTVPKSNALGKWYGLKFIDLGWVDAAEYANARAFNEFIEQGQQRPGLTSRANDAA